MRVPTIHDARTADQDSRDLHARRHEQRRVLPPAGPAGTCAGAGCGPRCPAAARDRQPRSVRQADRRHGRRDVQHQQDGDPVAEQPSRSRRRLPVRPGFHRQVFRRLERQLRQPVRGRWAVRDREPAGRRGARAAGRHGGGAHLAGEHREDHRGARADCERRGAGDGRFRTRRRDVSRRGSAARIHGPGGRGRRCGRLDVPDRPSRRRSRGAGRRHAARRR